MSETPANEAVVGPLMAASHKMFAVTAGEPPFPQFVNAVEFIVMGMDVIMDVGVVSPEAINAAREKQQLGSSPPTVDMHVNSRFGMSLQTAIMTHQRLTEILKLAQAQAQAQVSQASVAAEAIKNAEK